MKRRLIFSLVTVLLTLNLAIGARLYLNSAHAAGQDDSPDANLERFAEVLEKVRTSYVDGTNLTYHALVESALKGMVGSLDPHSEFMDAEDYQQLQNDTEGQFGGLGLVVAMKGGYITVVAPMEDTPGARAGIASGDRIIKVEGRSVDKVSLSDVVKQLRGKPGTPVTLTVERPSTGVVKNHTLNRAIITMKMVRDINGKKEFPLGVDKIGYIRITQFGDKTSDELEDALKKLKKQGMKALIIDLRWNPGGLLDEAVGVCEKFLPRGQLIVTTEGRDPRENSVRRADGHGDELNGMPMVVLANLGSASAAEIVTGCLQDLHRAYVIGEKTFGKGSVQTIFPLDDNSALKLTVAKYYTPSHKVIHEHGIMPDSLVPMSDADAADLLIKQSPGGLESLDGADHERVQNSQDIQFDRAEDLLKSILLYDMLAAPEKVGGEMTLLAIETSCDETSVAVVRDGRVLANAVSSQIELHAEYGGVVPELAAREHLRNLMPVAQAALNEAGVLPAQLDAVAATQGPGLSNALLVGFKAAQAVAFALAKPFVGINHHEAHLYSPWIVSEPGLFSPSPLGEERVGVRGENLSFADFTAFQPNISLIVSGGHTMIVLVASELNHRVLGGTIDDAAGECFDKTGKLMGLAYPAGPEIDRLAEQGNPQAFDFPRPLLNDASDDFSFSGLKTSVRYFIRDHPELLNDAQIICDLSASVQAAIIEVLVKKTIRAAKREGVRCVTASGGVTCNRALRQELARACEQDGFTLRLAEKNLCTDNAAMIGILAERKLLNKISLPPFDEDIQPGWALA